MNIERSIERDVKVMTKGLFGVDWEICMLEGNQKLRKAERKRLERLRAVKVQMVENPDECEKLVKRYKEMP
jgi:hypothetical protein